MTPPQGFQKPVPYTLILALLLSAFAIAPYLEPGYFWSAHDARHDVYFLFEFDRAVQDGIWFPRWAPDFTFGYGYPFWVVYGPLATFVGELFHHFLGLGWESSVETVYALSVLLSTLGMYGFVRSWAGPRAGLLAAAVHVYAPYHLVDLYVRAALAESVALAIVPFVMWAAREVALRPRLGAVTGLALAYAALMFTSNLVTLIFTPLLAVYIAVLVLYQANREQPWRQWSKESILPLMAQFVRLGFPPAIGLLLGLGLSAIFWIPALIESRYVNQEQWYGGYFSAVQHFIYPHQLFSPAWGFGISQPGPDDAAQGGLSFQIGAIPFVLTVLSLWASARARGVVRWELRLFQASLIGVLWLTLPVSAWAWEHLPIIPYAQFPWRYLMLALLPLATLSGSLLLSGGATPGSHDERLPDLATLALVALVILGSYPYLDVQVHEPTPEQGPVSLQAMMRFQRSADRMTGVTVWVDPAQRPRWGPLADVFMLGEDVKSRADYSNMSKDTVIVGSVDIGSAHEQLFFHAEGGERQVTFNIFWFPGWKAYLLDGQNGRIVRELKVTREDGPLARIVVTVPEGEGYMLLRFEDTPVRRAGKIISAATIALLPALWIGRWWLIRRF
ncbi:MAG: hypothetical protein RML36_13205 [Anaerolineae bacterium]|nr:hypothetical protein [Anaerolineae bacterium]MDW8100431.1 hypothetical protein [Anaerolineae bacterium]